MGAAVICGLALLCFAGGRCWRVSRSSRPMAALGGLALAAGLGLVSTELGLVPLFNAVRMAPLHAGFSGWFPLALWRWG